MGRRRKNDNAWVELLAGLGGLAVMFSLFNPQVRAFFVTVGWLGVMLLIACVLLLIGIIVYKKVRKRNGGGNGDSKLNVSDVLREIRG